MRAATEALATQIPVSRACDALAFPRSSLYRTRRPPVKEEPATRPRPARALKPQEKETVRDLLNSKRFCDRSPYQVYATLLDEGHYYCSISTMCRILREHNEVQERRNQRRHPSYSKPELLARAPNQLSGSWLHTSSHCCALRKHWRTSRASYVPSSGWRSSSWHGAGLPYAPTSYPSSQMPSARTGNERSSLTLSPSTGNRSNSCLESANGAWVESVAARCANFSKVRVRAYNVQWARSGRCIMLSFPARA